MTSALNDCLNLREEEAEGRVEVVGGRRGWSQGQETVWERSRLKAALTCLSVGVH